MRPGLLYCVPAIRCRAKSGLYVFQITVYRAGAWQGSLGGEVLSGPGSRSARPLRRPAIACEWRRWSGLGVQLGIPVYLGVLGVTFAHRVRLGTPWAPRSPRAEWGQVTPARRGRSELRARSAPCVRNGGCHARPRVAMVNRCQPSFRGRPVGLGRPPGSLSSVSSRPALPRR